MLVVREQKMTLYRQFKTTNNFKEKVPTFGRVTIRVQNYRYLVSTISGTVYVRLDVR